METHYNSNMQKCGPWLSRTYFVFAKSTKSTIGWAKIYKTQVTVKDDIREYT